MNNVCIYLVVDPATKGKGTVSAQNPFLPKKMKRGNKIKIKKGGARSF
jgi:hypothetical protein